MTERMKLAIIGAGLMGRHHLTVALANPEIEVVGVADPVAASRDKVASLGVPTFADYRELLDRAKPDGALIATPNAYHAPIAIDCILRGIPTLVEKPLADTLPAARAVLEAQQEAGTPVLVGHHRRHNPLLQAARAHIAEGGLGRLCIVAATWLRRKPDEYFEDAWKRDHASGGGVILINAVHDFDTLRMLCGDIEAICATTSNAVRGFDVEDTAAIVARFKSGMLATLAVSDTVVAPWCWEMTAREDPRFATVPENSYMICGTEASLSIPSLELWINEPNGGRDASFTRQRLYYVAADSMTLQMAHFVQVMRGEEGLRTAAATLAVAESVWQGGWINVDDFAAA
jgi:predicted dehydrogenase